MTDKGIAGFGDSKIIFIIRLLQQKLNATACD